MEGFNWVSGGFLLFLMVGADDFAVDFGAVVGDDDEDDDVDSADDCVVVVLGFLEKNEKRFF